MKHLICFLTFAGLFFSCQHEEADAPFATDTDISVLPSTEKKASDNGLLGWVALTGQTHISAEEAQETALATAMQMREVEGIVTKAPLKIGSIEVVKGDTRKLYVPTKGNAKPEQADVYIVNFANNQGYVVTSGDRRVPGVLAYNSYGHLGDTISNPGQAILFSYMQAYIEEQRESFEANKEKLATEAKEAIFKQLSKERREALIAQGLFDKEGKWIKSKKEEPDERKDGKVKNFLCIEPEHYTEDIYIYGEWKTKVIGPLIKTLWGQSADYSEKVPVLCGENKAPVGCVSVAVGQLLAYHKKPDSVVGRKMHWEDMTKISSGNMFSNIYSALNPIAKEDIQYLLAHLGDSNLLDMKYTCDKGSSSNIDKALHTLHQLGYKGAYVENFRTPNVISEIEKWHPIYIKASDIIESYKKGWWIFKQTYYKYSGHAWIIDGYMRRYRKVEMHTTCDSPDDFLHVGEEGFSLVHHNLGWGGSTDGSSIYNGSGWYNLGIFDTNGHKESSNTYKSGIEGNFQYKVETILNIK